jgi:hypothetical protein
MVSPVLLVTDQSVSAQLWLDGIENMLHWTRTCNIEMGMRLHGLEHPALDMDMHRGHLYAT